MNGDISVLFYTDYHKTNDVAQAGFRLMAILIHLSPKCWDNRCEFLAFSLKSPVLTLRLPDAGNYGSEYVL